MPNNKKQDRYHGEVPKCLNPFNPKHYLLLIYWRTFAQSVKDVYLERNDTNISKINNIYKTLIAKIQKKLNISYTNNSLLGKLDIFFYRCLRFFNSKVYRSLIIIEFLILTSHFFITLLLIIILFFYCIDNIKLSRNHFLPITALGVSNDSKQIISASLDGGQKLWNLETGEVENLKTGNYSNVLKCLVPSFNIFDSQNIETINNCFWQKKPFYVTIDDNKKTAFIVYTNGKIDLWNLTNKKLTIIEPNNNISEQEKQKYINLIQNKYSKILTIPNDLSINVSSNDNYVITYYFFDKKKNDIKDKYTVLFIFDKNNNNFNYFEFNNQITNNEITNNTLVIKVSDNCNTEIKISNNQQNNNDYFMKNEIIISNCLTGESIGKTTFSQNFGVVLAISPDHHYAFLSKNKFFGDIGIWDLKNKKEIQLNLSKRQINNFLNFLFSTLFNFLNNLLLNNELFDFLYTLFICFPYVLFILFYFIFLLVDILQNIIIYYFLILLAYLSQFKLCRHPHKWNGYNLILPGGEKILIQKLQHNENDGLSLMVDLSYNLFQLKVIHNILKSNFNKQKNPLYFLYKILTINYFIAPKNDIIEQYILLFILSGLNENLTKLTPLMKFSELIEDLLIEKTINFAEYQETFNQIRKYPSGDEIADTFEIMDIFLSYQDWTDLIQAKDLIKNKNLPPEDQALRPSVIKTLQTLGDISNKIVSYKASSSQARKLRLLVEIIEQLKQLDQYVDQEVITPEKFLLEKIISQWKELIEKATGKEINFEELKPINNPYITGNPVTGELFVGREDILTQLESIWGNQKQAMSVVLYGHRRMGKTSILQNLGQRFDEKTIIVDFDMQRINVENNHDLLFNLARKIYFAWNEKHPNTLEKPQKLEFLDDGYLVFDEFLMQLNQVRQNYRFIITVDEFENIEKKIIENKLDASILDYWRSVFQTYQWFIMALAGQHTLEEMTKDYFNALFGSVKAIKVSFLSQESAEKLITKPYQYFELNYNWEAVHYIINLTNGQAYLIQLICHYLVEYFNQEMFDKGKKIEEITKQDVEKIISHPEFNLNGSRYFNGVWQQAECKEMTNKMEGQTKVLEVLCHKNSMSFNQLIKATNFDEKKLTQALTALKNHDVIKEESGYYSYTVELMRRWVQQKTQTN